MTEILPGVKIRFAPIGIKAVRAARRKARQAFGVDPEDVEEISDELSRELLRRGILAGGAWEGVEDLSGQALPVTEETVEAFLANPVAYEAASRAYLLEWELAEMEKNAFAASRSGTSTEATAANATASSSATATPQDGANPIPTKDGKDAPTASMSSKPKKPSRSSR